MVEVTEIAFPSVVRAGTDVRPVGRGTRMAARTWKDVRDSTVRHTIPSVRREAAAGVVGAASPWSKAMDEARGSTIPMVVGSANELGLREPEALLHLELAVGRPACRLVDSQH